MEVVDALRALGGTARWKDLEGHVSWRELRRAKADGAVVRAGQAYHLADSGRDVVLARQLRGVRTHVTAAAHWGLALPPLDGRAVDICIPPNAARRDKPADASLRYRTYAPGDVDGDVTAVLATVIDCLRDEPLQVALCVGDSALNQRLVTKRDLRTRAASLRGPRSALVRQRVELLDAGAANAFESSCRALLLDNGITGFRPQVTIRHRGDFVGRVDLADEILRIVIECDGFDTHGGRDAFIKDRVRMTYLVSAGWRPLQFTWEQVMFGGDWVLERVLDTIAEAKAVA